MANALRDENRIATLLAVSNVDGITPVTLYADPVTHRLLVDIPGSGSTLAGLSDVALSSPQNGQVLTYNSSTSKWYNSTVAGSGTVTTVSVATANGLAGTVATATTTPVITLTTSVTGVLKGNGTTISACSNLADVAYLTSLTGAVLTDQTAGQTIGATGTRLTKLWATDITVTNAIAGSVTGNAATVTTNANLTGPVTSTGNATAIATGAIKANMLQSAAADLGAADVTINLGNTNGSFNTNLTTDGTITATGGFSGALTGTASGNLTSASTLDASKLSGTATSLTLVTPVLGTPSSGTLTSCTGLPIAGLVASTSTAIGVGSIELGHATDTTIARVSGGVISVEGVTVPTISSTNTLTNKRLTVRTGSTTSSATPTINTDNVDIYLLTAQAADITSFTTNLSGTPTEGQLLWISITGTAARAITWGTSFEASTIALPTTTVTTARLDIGFVWNTVSSKWRCIAAA